MSDDTRGRDDLAERLRRLEPAVDMTASRALFERSRTAPAVPRWLMPAAAALLIVGGIVGLFALGSGDDDVRPSAETDPADERTTVTEGDGYDTVLVAEARTGFGNAELVTSDEQLDALWAEWTPGPDRPPVDFDRSVALVTTRPDNACPDTLVRFERAPVDASPATWTAVFEDLSEACNDPLLSWIYVVAIDRSVLGSSSTIVLPAQEIFEVPEQRLEYVSDGPPGTSTTDDTATLTDTGIVIDLPEVGSPTLHNLSVGLVWVVAHDDGTVSVLPGTVDVSPASSEDAGGVTLQQRLVYVSSDGDLFFSGPTTWDTHGRAITGGRLNDLGGLIGRVVDDEVQVWTSDDERVAGAPDPAPDRVGTSPERTLAELRRAVGEPIDPMTFFTLSSSGPIWRYFDATLVVETGVGRICQVPTAVPVTELTGCAAAEIAIDTQATSGDPLITTWFHAPILAFQDPMRGFTSFVPLGGISSRNDTPEPGDPDVEVVDVRYRCGPQAGIVLVEVDLRLNVVTTVELNVIERGEEIGTGLLEGPSGPANISIDVAREPGPDAELRVSFASTDLTVPLPDDAPTCP